MKKLYAGIVATLGTGVLLITLFVGVASANTSVDCKTVSYSNYFGVHNYEVVVNNSVFQNGTFGVPNQPGQGVEVPLPDGDKHVVLFSDGNLARQTPGTLDCTPATVPETPSEAAGGGGGTTGTTPSPKSRAWTCAKLKKVGAGPNWPIWEKLNCKKPQPKSRPKPKPKPPAPHPHVPVTG